MNHVLIIEADVSTARLMGWILAEAGFETDRVALPLEAVERVKQGQPDVIVFNSDLSATDVSVWIDRIRAGAPDVRVVDMVQAALRSGHPAAGARGMLLAPFDAETLVRAVQDAEGGPIARRVERALDEPTPVG